MWSEKILKFIIYTGLFLIPFVPLYISASMFFPFITGKALFFRIAVEIIFGSWLILALRNPDYRPRRTLLFYAINIFVLIIALADIFSGHFLKSFWSNFERMEGLVTLLHLLAYFYVLTSFIKEEKIWDRLLQTSVGVSLIIGLRGFFQLFGLFQSSQSGARLDATFGNASYLAIYMFFHVFLTAYLFTRHRGSKFVKWIYGIIIAFQAFILIFTQTRGTILALFGSTFLTFLLIAIFEKEKIKLKKVSIGVLTTLIILGGVFFLARDSKIVQGIGPLQRLASISLTDRTTTSRFLIWDMAYQGFKEKPILGWGQENFIFVFEKYYDPAMYAQEPWFDRAHNIFFDWLIAGGALGLLAYLSLFILSFYSLWKSVTLSVVQKSLLASLLIGYFFHNIFVFDNISSYILFITVLSLISFKSTEDSETEEESSQEGLGSAYLTFLTLAIIVLTVFSIYFFNTKGVLASKALIQALSGQQEGITKNLEFYEKALSYNTYGNQEIREQIVTTAIQAINLNIDPQIKEQFSTFARAEMQKQIDENPTSVRHQLFMGSYLNRLGLSNEALPYLEEALKFSPKKQQIYFDFVSSFLNTNQTDKAVEIAREAFELDERFNDARIIYAISLIYNNQSNLAEEIIKEQFENIITGDERLARAYFNTGQFEKTILVWQELLDQNPNNVQHITALAATYLEAGLREEAMNELRKAIEIDPSFKEQGEFFIKEIQAGRNP